MRFMESVREVSKETGFPEHVVRRVILNFWSSLFFLLKRYHVPYISLFSMITIRMKTTDFLKYAKMRIAQRRPYDRIINPTNIKRSILAIGHRGNFRKNCERKAEQANIH